MKLNHKTYGNSGRPVIILHGIFGMLDNWHSFASQLAKENKVITVDHRNHGRSPHSEEFDYNSMVGDLMELINNLRLDKVSLIGHSMGGKVAMHFALIHPEKVEELIVLDIGIKYYPPRHDYIFKALCELDPGRFESRNQIDEYLSGHIHNFAIRQFLIKNIRRSENRGFEWKMNLPVIRKNYEKITEWIPVGQDFKGRTLFIRGANSSYISMEDWPGIQELFPNAELVTIPGASHWLHAEKPYELLKEVKAFIKE